MECRRSFAKLLFFLFLSVVFIEFSFAENFPVAQAIKSQGDWQEGEITQRKVVFTDKAKVQLEININVPHPGNYQLFAYVHHNWRKHIPCIYIEAWDSKGKIHLGGACIENCWYFKGKESGRWFMVSLSENPYWVLPKGELKIQFWVDSKSSVWKKALVTPEGKVAIESFLLLPILESKAEFFSSGIIYPETGEGDWKISDYHPEYDTDLVLSDKPASFSNCKINIPVSGYYQGWISVLADSDDLLKMRIKKVNFKREIKVKLKKTKNWVSVPLEPLYLEKGEYILLFKNSEARVLIDYFLLLPYL